jgi:hypothetical protein
MPTVITEGAASARGFGFGASGAGAGNYIEDVFSTYLYTGTGAAQTITNEIDLSTKGGLVWLKSRSAASSHNLIDTVRGRANSLSTDTASIPTPAPAGSGLTSFNSNGFSLGTSWNTENFSGYTYASWTFREQPKFFDIVTYTGTGSNTTIAHNLGSTPGCIIVKRTDTTSDWQVYHSGLTSAAYSIQLNLTSAQASATTIWNSTAPTSSVFSVGTDASVNASGGTYVAYIYASNAGGFGAAGTDNVISCGSFTVSSGTGSTDVNLGYEPQWLLAKPSTDPGFATNWNLYDTMRGWVNTTNAGNVNARLNPNTATAEATDKLLQPTATGFTMLNSNVYPGVPITYIYIAIRRGPMKTPTDATKVFSPISVNNAQGTQQTTGFPVDLQMVRLNAQNSGTNTAFIDRLRGVSTTSTSASSPYLASSSTSTESTALSNTQAWGNTGFQNSSYYGSIQATFHNISRAPGFFDEVCYTGTGANTTQTHNLGVAPEFMIVKSRILIREWQVYHSGLTSAAYSIQLDLTSQQYSSPSTWNSTAPTSSVFSVGTDTSVNASGYTYVAYLFATCPGVSKVGSYTGTGATQTIDCGFTGGARFVMIKRTDSTGDWYVWDTARGMVSGTDPSLLLNSTAAEVNANSVYTATTGFQIVSTAAGINASGGSYIFLAIA